MSGKVRSSQSISSKNSGMSGMVPYRESSNIQPRKFRTKKENGVFDQDMKLKLKRAQTLKQEQHDKVIEEHSEVDDASFASDTPAARKKGKF